MREQDIKRLIRLVEESGIDELRNEEREGPYDKGTRLAARRAVEQIDRIKQERARSTAMS